MRERRQSTELVQEYALEKAESLDGEKIARLAEVLWQRSDKNPFLQDVAGFLRRSYEQYLQDDDSRVTDWYAWQLEPAPARIAQIAMQTEDETLARSCFELASPACQWKMVADAYKAGQVALYKNWWDAAETLPVTGRITAMRESTLCRIYASQYADAKGVLEDSQVQYYKDKALAHWRAATADDQTYYAAGTAFSFEWLAREGAAVGLMECADYLPETERLFYKSRAGQLSRREKWQLYRRSGRADACTAFEAYAILGVGSDVYAAEAARVRAKVAAEGDIFWVDTRLRRVLTQYRPDLYCDWQLHQLQSYDDGERVVGQVRNGEFGGALRDYHRWVTSHINQPEVLVSFALDLAPYADEIALADSRLSLPTSVMRDTIKDMVASVEALRQLPDVQKSAYRTAGYYAHLERLMETADKNSDVMGSFLELYKAFKVQQAVESRYELQRLKAHLRSIWQAIDGRPSKITTQHQLEPLAREVGIIE